MLVGGADRGNQGKSWPGKKSSVHFLHGSYKGPVSGGPGVSGAVGVWVCLVFGWPRWGLKQRAPREYWNAFKNQSRSQRENVAESGEESDSSDGAPIAAGHRDQGA